MSKPKSKKRTGARRHKGAAARRKSKSLIAQVHATQRRHRRRHRRVSPEKLAHLAELRRRYNVPVPRRETADSALALEREYRRAKHEYHALGDALREAHEVAGLKGRSK